jgi:hypothetical protein
LRFGFGAGATAKLVVHGGVTTCWGSDCGALSRGVTGVEVTAAASHAAIELAAFADHIHLLAPHLPPDPLRGSIRRRHDGTAVTGCFRCDRPLPP